MRFLGDDWNVPDGLQGGDEGEDAQSWPIILVILVRVSSQEIIVRAKLNLNSSWEGQSTWMDHTTPPYHHHPLKLVRHFQAT